MVDIAISFDATGSMGPCLHQVRVGVKRFLENIVGAVPDVRIALITHGDYDSSRYLTRYMDFTSDVDGMRDYIQKIDDAGGNSYDDGEAYEEMVHLGTTL